MNCPFDVKDTDKKRLRDFWERAACGEELYLPRADRVCYEAQGKQRYALEPFILEFARFETSKGRRVLEVGVGLGSDHQKFAEAGAKIYGIDLTKRAIVHTKRRLDAFGLSSRLCVADAEHLPFPDGFFDLVYSWGVLHHTPNTVRAVDNLYRVLREGGVARLMLYHKWSMVGLMLWVRYALCQLRPWKSISWVYAQYLESPGTKAYSVTQARKLFSDFRGLRIRTILTHGDLLLSQVGQRHRGRLLAIVKRIWPRWVIRRAIPRAGLFMLIEVTK